MISKLAGAVTVVPAPLLSGWQYVCSLFRICLCLWKAYNIHRRDVIWHSWLAHSLTRSVRQWTNHWL